MPTERAFFAQPIPGAGGRIIASPFQFVSTGEDNLRITSVNSLVGVHLKVQGRRLDSSGDIKSAAWDHTPSSDRMPTTSDVELGSGALLNLVVFASAGSPKQGQTFVIVQLIRGVGTAAIVLGTLLQGYVTGTQGLGWPGSPIQSSIEGGGIYRVVSGTQPAVGVFIQEIVPTGARWDVISLAVDLTTDATVITRQPIVTFLSGGIGQAAAWNYGAIAASTARTFMWSQGLALDNVPANGSLVSGLPVNLVLLGGSQIFVNCAFLQAGDQFGAPLLSVREWLEVN